MIKKNKISLLTRSANIARNIILDLVFKSGSGHIGPSFSVVEILTYLIEVKKIYKKKKSKLILSKGHAAPALYACMHNAKIIDNQDLSSFRSLNSKLQGHPDRLLFNDIHCSTGSLGQGLSVALGYSIGNKILKYKEDIYCILGDGELQEGQIWEALLFLSANKVTNLITIIDNNKYQNELEVKKTLNLGNLYKKLISFDFNVYKINGHSFSEIDKTFKKIDIIQRRKPICIILDTIKGKGVKFMENNNIWHSKKLDQNNYEKAKKYLNQ